MCKVKNIYYNSLEGCVIMGRELRRKEAKRNGKNVRDI